MSKNGSKVRLVGDMPPYQLWSQADIEAGARKAAQRKALQPRPAEASGLQLTLPAVVSQVCANQCFVRSARLPVNLIGSPINYANRLIGSPITSQSTGQRAFREMRPAAALQGRQGFRGSRGIKPQSHAL